MGVCPLCVGRVGANVCVVSPPSELSTFTVCYTQLSNDIHTVGVVCLCVCVWYSVMGEGGLVLSGQHWYVSLSIVHLDHRQRLEFHPLEVGRCETCE